MTLSSSNMTTMETYKILSSNGDPYTLNDFQIMENIVQEAEERGREDQTYGKNSGKIQFCHGVWY